MRIVFKSYYNISLCLFLSLGLDVISLNPVFATENNLNKATEINAIAVEESADSNVDVTEMIPSPLKTADEDHGKLLISAFDPTHYVYPVKILSIDDWEVNDKIVEDDLRLARGDHHIILIPDFSNIEEKRGFMRSPWIEKKVAFSIENDQSITITARLMNRDKIEWKVQMYQLKSPIKPDDYSSENP